MEKGAPGAVGLYPHLQTNPPPPPPLSSLLSSLLRRHVADGAAPLLLILWMALVPPTPSLAWAESRCVQSRYQCQYQTRALRVALDITVNMSSAGG